VKKWSKNVFEEYLYNSLEKHIDDDNKWNEEILYSIKAGGKRFRPALCFSAGIDLGLNDELLYRIGCAVELIHTASLIHDDLPEIDNDDFRRGIPSHHKVYGQGNAVIAADYIFFLAFMYISEIENSRLNKYFSKVAMDLVYGEYLDVRYENKKINDMKLIEKMYELKTARLIQFPILSPALYVNKEKEHINRLSEAGKILGITFQIMDDIKGIEGNFEDIGKTPQKDLDSNKTTIASILGIEKSKELVSEGKEQFLKILKEIRDFDGTEYTNMVQYLKYIWKTLENK
jgi:geranylgeranyl diphosphate synthase type II